MKKNSFKMSLWAALMLLGSVVMTGCVSETDEYVSPATEGSTLTININSGAVGYITRSSDINNVETAKVDEKKIQNMVIAVFQEDTQDNNTLKLVYYNYLSGINQSAASGFSTTVDNVSPTTAFAAGDWAVIITNTPAEVFAGVKALGTTMADFKAASVSISQALDSDADGAAESDCLPMYGAVQIATNASNHLVADVTVRHMVSKVTLESLKVDGIAAGCSFKPEQVFLYKVADGLTFNFTTENDFSTYLSPTVSTWYTGEASQSAEANYAAYLGTKVYTDGDGDLETLDGTNTTWTKQCVLYAMPNVFASPVEGDDTRLVIKGTWTDTNTPANNGTCYYNFRILNVVSGQAMEALAYRKLYPNRNYRLKVILKRKGAESIDAGVTAQASTAVAFNSVSEWGAGTQNTEFGDNGQTNS